MARDQEGPKRSGMASPCPHTPLRANGFFPKSTVPWQEGVFAALQHGVLLGTPAGKIKTVVRPELRESGMPRHTVASMLWMRFQYCKSGWDEAEMCTVRSPASYHDYAFKIPSTGRVLASDFSVRFHNGRNLYAKRTYKLL